MANYLIVCVRKSDVEHPVHHGHIVQVGLGTSLASYDTIWTVGRVLEAMAAGDTFFTQGESTGKRATVHPYSCEHCGIRTIRSGPDAAQDNNLDNLDTCG